MRIGPPSTPSLVARIGLVAGHWVRSSLSRLSRLPAHGERTDEGWTGILGEPEWSETMPAVIGTAFRLKAWPADVAAMEHHRLRRLRAISALSIGPFGFESVVALLGHDRPEACSLFCDLMVRGYIEVYDDGPVHTRIH